MCYCGTPEKRVIQDIRTGSVPADALMEDHCWRTICRVRGGNISQIPPQAWSELCQKRGYLQNRQNPRGY
jgi:hypothetical protein